jgi:hypothetical protein
MIDPYILPVSFVFTCLVEVCVVALYLRSVRRAVLSVLIANMLTHPVFILWGYHVLGLPVLLMELCVFAVEAGVYRYWLKLTLREACTCSFLANSASYILGALMWYTLWGV